MVAKNPKLKEEPSMEDPPMLDWPERVQLKMEDGETAPPTNGGEPAAAIPAGEKKISALAILCLLTALMSFLFFPALAALPLGIFALRRINASDGKLTGRHLAIPGICISVVALSAWLALTVGLLAAWTALSVMAVAAWVAVIAVGWVVWQLMVAIVTLLQAIWNALF